MPRDRKPVQRFDVEVDGANDDKRLNRVRGGIAKKKKPATVEKKPATAKKPQAKKSAVAKKPSNPLHFTYFGVMAKGLGPLICLEVSETPFTADFAGPKGSGGMNWQTLKPETPFGQLPILRDGDLMVGQTVAICQYIGRKCNMLGNNSDHDFAMCSMLLAETEDIYGATQKLCPTVYVQVDAKGGIEGYTTWAEEQAPAHLDKLEKLLKEKDTLCFTETGKTVGELYFFAMMHQILLVLPTILDTRPSLKAFYEATLARPAVKKVLDGESAFAMKQYFVAP